MVASTRLLQIHDRPAARPWSRRACVRFATAMAAIAAMACTTGCSEGPIDRVRARLELKQGNLSYLRGDYRTAIQHYDRAVLSVRDDSQVALNKAYSWVALFRASTGREVRRELADSAIASFRNYDTLRQRTLRKSSSEPDLPQVEKHILSLMLDSGQSERAIREVLRPRLERNPQDVTTLLMLANLASDRGACEETLDFHRQRIAIEPQNHAAHYGLAVVVWKFSHYQKMTHERRVVLLEEGLRAGLRSVELKPDNADALTYLNLLYREMAECAETDIERATFEAKYKQYEKQAKQIRDAQKNREALQQKNGPL